MWRSDVNDVNVNDVNINVINNKLNIHIKMEVKLSIL